MDYPVITICIIEMDKKKAMEEAVNIFQSLSDYVIKAAAGMSVFTRRSNVKCSPMDYIYPELCTDEQALTFSF